jgi:hypothetical protein
MEGAAEAFAQADSTAPGTGRTIMKSLPDAKLAVIGSNELISDLMVGIGQQLRGQMHLSNAQLIVNLLDWSVEETDLASIRSAGAYARTLEPLEESEIRNIEIGNYVAVLGGMLIAVVVPRRRRAAVAVATRPSTVKEQKA